MPYSDSMIKFYPQIISEQNRKEIYSTFLHMVLNDQSKYFEGKTEALMVNGVGRGFGVYSLPITLKEIDKFIPIIENDFGNFYEFTHSYLRIYPNNSVLHPHIDRVGLDLTLSVNIYCSENTYWPLIISNTRVSSDHPEFCADINDKHFMDNYGVDSTAYNFLPGDGACCTREHPHWRPFYTMAFEGDHYMQCFYHWKLK